DKTNSPFRQNAPGCATGCQGTARRDARTICPRKPATVYSNRQAIFQFSPKFFTIKLGGIGKMRNFALQKANETGKLPE
ncbi:MAG: hypothetical protein ACOCNQ_06885, partial [Bacteroidales bacterium]